MINSEIIRRTEDFVKTQLANAEGGHDWWHIYRVWKLAKQIAENEGVDSIIIDLGSLLHDIADAKFHDGDEEIGPKISQEFLESLEVDDETIDHIDKIIRNISFKNSKDQKFRSPELDIIQDADRLDAIGAIGIARAFNYGGFKNRAIYNPEIEPNLNMTKAEYKKSLSPTVNHFYEKLFLLKEMMNTKTGREMAEERHQFMVDFLDQFYEEWKRVK